MNFELKEPEDMTPEERLDALAEVFAEGFLTLAEKGLLQELDSDKERKVDFQTKA